MLCFNCWFWPFICASLVAQTVKCLPAMLETRVQFLGREDPLEREMAIHSSTLAWKTPWTEEPDRLQSMGSQRFGQDWATSLSLSIIILKWEGEGDDRGWDGWLASPTRWTWVWANSGSWWWTGRPGMLRFMGSQHARAPSRSPLDKNPMPGHLPELHPVNEVNTKGQFFRASFGKKPQVPKTARQGASLPGDISRGKRSSIWHILM